MYSVAVLGMPSAAPPPGADNVRITVSSGSGDPSARIVTLKVWLVSPWAKLSVPLADWSTQAIGDYDGDGREDLLWLSNAGTVIRWRMQGRFVDKIVEPIVGVGDGWASVQ